MKKLLTSLVVAIVLNSITCLAAAPPCRLIWRDVANQTYELVLGNRHYNVIFSDGYAGPCPQGSVEIYDDIYVAPILICSYTSDNDDFVYINCGTDEDIPFILYKGKLEFYKPTNITMTRKVCDE